MSCYHPLKAFVTGTTPAGKQELKVCGYMTDHVELVNGKWQASSCSLPSSYASQVRRESVTIPCGQCIGCRLDYSRQWADRCMLELQNHKSSYFLTLTYDDEHVPWSAYGDTETGEALPSLTLRKKDFQDFMKRLRKNTGQELRYFMCGEYGSNSFRPHYHAIVFGLELDDLVEYKKSDQGFTYFSSDMLNSTWKHGYAVVADVSWETCAYTARYVVKKLKGSLAEFYDTYNIEPEFCLMSRRPGIGNQYFQEHPKIYDYDRISISTPTGGLSFKPPRYYDKLYDALDPESMAELKDNRKYFAEELQKAKMQSCSLNYIEMLEVEERNKLASIKSLERGDI